MEKLPEQSAPANPEKIITKIEAVPFDQFWRYEEPELDPDSWEDVEAGLGVEDHVKKLSYKPFRPDLELKNIRKLSPEEETLPREEQRRIQQERLRIFKRNLEWQKIGIGQTIQELYHAVRSDPELDYNKLMWLVEGIAPKYKFSKGQISQFEWAMDEYARRHRAVERARKKYPIDEDLFEACFSKRPNGKIEVIQRPMIFHIRCWDLEDYINAFYEKDRPGDITAAERKHASMTGGVAKFRVGIPDLLATVENVPTIFVDSKNIPVRKTEKIKGGEFELFIPQQKDNIRISSSGGEAWEIRVVERDDRGEPAHLKLVSVHEEKTIHDVRIIEPPQELQEKFHIFYKILEDVDEGKQKRARMALPLKSGENLLGYIRTDGGVFLRVEAFVKELSVEYTTDEFVMTTQREPSEATLIHEEQHQFNKLFVPMEIRWGQLAIMERVAENAKSPEEAKKMLIHELVRAERRWAGLWFDKRARDEILAYYRDGRLPHAIYETLANNPIYDYFDQEKEAIAKIPERIQKTLREQMTVAMYAIRSDEFGGYKYPLEASALEVDSKEIEPYIDLVFKDEYRADLKRWLGAIENLEEKGYKREEIVALLYQEPARVWPNMVKRITNKTTS